jgi:CPA1 family monovalent cation:H+ antiporter
MLLFTAFTVTLGTLLLQGLTLRPLVAALDVRDDGPVERETRRARAVSTEAAIAALAGETGEEAQQLRASLIAERDFAAQANSGDGRPIIAAKALHQRALDARRQSLLALRDHDEIGDATFQSLEQELDVMEMAIATRR